MAVHQQGQTCPSSQLSPGSHTPHQQPARLLRATFQAREELERSSRGTYCAPRHRHTESRMRLLQRYCEDVCAQADIASSSVMVAFFWPSEERGDGPVVAPDGSRATMLGGE